MKKYILILIGFMFLGFGLNAQKSVSTEYVDSLVTSSSLDTVTFTFSYDLRYQGDIGLFVQAVENSGTSNAVVHYQGRKLDGTYWHTLSTDTISASGYNSYQPTYCVFDEYRMLILAPSSTQNTDLYGTIIYKRDR